MRCCQSGFFPVGSWAATWSYLYVGISKQIEREAGGASGLYREQMVAQSSVVRELRVVAETSRLFHRGTWSSVTGRH